MARKKKEEVVETSTKKTKKTSTRTIVAEDGTIMTLAEIEKKLLKKANSPSKQSIKTIIFLPLLF